MTAARDSRPSTPLRAPVRVLVKSKEECQGDPLLEDFRCAGTSAAEEVRMIVENLLCGEALPQTVAMLIEEWGGGLVALASIRLDGNAQIRADADVPWFLRRLASNPYVNLIARDERYRDHVLADGSTRVGRAALRAGLEVVQAAHPGQPMPTTWALVRRDNEPSRRTFGAFAFYPHDRSRENQQDVFVRRAGRPLPAAPDPRGYRPLLGEAVERASA